MSTSGKMIGAGPLTATTHVAFADMASKTSSSLSNMKNYFAALLQEEEGQMKSSVVPTKTTTTPKRGVVFKAQPSVMAPPAPVVGKRTTAQVVARASPRKAVHRHQLNKAAPAPLAKVPTSADFPQLTVGRPVNPGIWGNTSPVHAAASLPDPAIALKAEREAARARAQAVIRMYKKDVYIDDIGDIDDGEIDDIIETLHQQEAAAQKKAAQSEIAESKKKQPPRHRLQEDSEDELDFDETYVIKDGRLTIQGPEVPSASAPARVEVFSPEPMSDDEYEDWEDRLPPTSRAPPGGWFNA